MINYSEDLAERYGYNERPIKRHITRLHCGDTITCYEKDDRLSESQKIKYKIVKIYPYFALGICKDRKRCFSIGDLVIMGIEPSVAYV